MTNDGKAADKNKKEESRKIQKVKRSYDVTLPIACMREFWWDKKREVAVRKSGKKLFIESV